MSLKLRGKGNAYEKKATSLQMCKCKFIHIRTFHVTWTSFFVCFFAWFGVVSLYNPYVIETLNLQNDSDTQTMIFTRGNTVSALATIIFRIVIGFFCDFMGARYSYLVVIIVGTYIYFI